jgi:hypothetical protein
MRQRCGRTRHSSVQNVFKLDCAILTFLGFMAMILASCEYGKKFAGPPARRNSFSAQELATA